MNLYKTILEKNTKISVIGLGYVGIPLAVAFSKKADVIGFDINRERIEIYKKGIDITQEVGNKELKESNILFTYNEEELKNAKFHIIAVPTPIYQDKAPDLSLIKNATKTLGRNLTKNSIVVYESTVFPGTTEGICIPILEKESNLKCGVDFKVGYSPERINPGDKIHKLNNIVKIVSGIDRESLNNIAEIYELIINAGIYKAESIKIAEAAKIVENSQRDINIAFMNELSIIFNKMNIDTKSVLNAAKTKWNFIDFYPGLVGGHCIGVDPYYLSYEAENIGYHSQIILSGRRINDDMGKYIAQNVIKSLINANILVKNANICILGFTFKENCKDIRNTKVIDIIKELNNFEINPVIVDPIADKEDMKNKYKIEAKDIKEINNMDAIIIAVAHDCFRNLNIDDINKMYKTNLKNKVLIDIKGIFEKKCYERENYIYWRL